MVISCEREGRLGGKLDRIWTFMVCIDDLAWFLKAWLCPSRFPFLAIFGAFSWPLSCGGFETFLFRISWEMYAWTPRGSFHFDSPPKYVSKGSRLWGFLLSRVRGVLAGISSIPLGLASFGGPNLGYGVPMRRSYYPQSLVQIRGENQEIKVWIWWSWPAGCCSYRAAQAWPVWLVLVTGRTGARPLWDLSRVNYMVRVSLGSVVAGQFLSGLEEFG
jgi:hypothetical protein